MNLTYVPPNTNNYSTLAVIISVLVGVALMLGVIFAIRALVKLMIKASTDPKARREMNYIIRIVERFAILTVFLRMFGGRRRR